MYGSKVEPQQDSAHLFSQIQDQSLHCGTGCQAEFGTCQTSLPIPADPPGPPGVSTDGETCGPIVNKKCANGLCCSGSNFCGMPCQT